MNKKKIQIICTLGPSSLNKSFLKFASNNIDLLRLNMSHLSVSDVEKNIKFIKKYTNCPICIDTEGAQIRSKFKKRIFYRKGSIIFIDKNNNNSLALYPDNVIEKLKTNDILDIGFENLKIKLIKKNNQGFLAKVIRDGFLEGNKGIFAENRDIILDYLTKKDFEAIKIGKFHKVNSYALSFTNGVDDIKNFNKLTSKKNNIFKIETKKSVKEFKKILRYGNNFLIDRGDLSKEISIYKIPKIQRELVKAINGFKKKKIFIATNLLESMIENIYPTRAEANDIYSCIEMGADGLVLAAETAVGKNPKSCINFLKEMINQFK